MNLKAIIISLFATVISHSLFGQKIIVDSTSSNKYIIRPVEKQPTEKVEAPKPSENQDPNFGDRALSIGKGILNRLKARLNLEEASESLKEKKQKLLGKKEEEKEGGG